MIMRRSGKNEDDDAWVRVENYPNAILAELGKSRLSENGIASKIFDEMMGAFYANAVGGVRLMVRSANYTMARKILGSESPIGEEAVDAESEISSSSPYCFRCHSKNLKVEEKAASINPFKKYFRKLFGIGKSVRCLDCGNEWMS